MDVPREITKRVQVLRFVDAVSPAPATGQPGVDLLRFAATLDPEAGKQMIAAIEEECEQIDPAADW